MSSMRSAGPVAAVALATVAVDSPGCGSRSDPVASAASKSRTAGGMHVTTTVTLRFPSGGQGVTSGAGDFDERSGELALDLSNVLQNSGLPIGSGAGVVARYL